MHGGGVISQAGEGDFGWRTEQMNGRWALIVKAIPMALTQYGKLNIKCITHYGPYFGSKSSHIHYQ